MHTSHTHTHILHTLHTHLHPPHTHTRIHIQQKTERKIIQDGASKSSWKNGTEVWAFWYHKHLKFMHSSFINTFSMNFLKILHIQQKICRFCLFVSIFKQEGLAMLPRPASNSPSSCFTLQAANSAGPAHCTVNNSFNLSVCFKSFIRKCWDKLRKFVGLPPTAPEPFYLVTYQEISIWKPGTDESQPITHSPTLLKNKRRMTCTSHSATGLSTWLA